MMPTELVHIHGAWEICENVAVGPPSFKVVLGASAGGLQR